MNIHKFPLTTVSIFASFVCASLSCASPAERIPTGTAEANAPLKAGLASTPVTVSDLLELLIINNIPVTLESSGTFDADPFEAHVKADRPARSLSDVLALVESRTGFKSVFGGPGVTLHDPLIEKTLRSNPFERKIRKLSFRDATIVDALLALSSASGFVIRAGFIQNAVMGRRATFDGEDLTLREALRQLAKAFGKEGYTATLMFLGQPDYPYPVEINVSL